MLNIGIDISFIFDYEFTNCNYFLNICFSSFAIIIN